LEKDAWEGEGIELFIRCKEIIQEFEEKNKEVSDEELYRIGEGFFKELYELNSK
jgi:hypothetical protein